MLQNFLHQRRCRRAIVNVRRNGFWFVDIPRTSSSSIRAELGRQFGDPYGKANLIPEYSQSQSFDDHTPAFQIRDRIGKSSWNKCFTFTFVRNPWDRLASIFRYRERVQAIPTGLSFRDYVLQFLSPRYLNPLSAHHGHFYYYSMAEYILDEQDNLIVDYIGRFENRERDLKNIADRIGCPSLGQVHLQRTNDASSHYSSHYDSETRDIVAHVFKRDIEMFDYSFDEA